MFVLFKDLNDLGPENVIRSHIICMAPIRMVP